MNSKNAIVERSFEFALQIIDFCELLEEQKHFVIAKQLLRSGTSIGANIHEAQSSESINDFIHKLKIAEKEAVETEYWLRICEQARNYPFDEQLMSKLTEINKLLGSIIYTSKLKLEQRNQHS